jgi:ribosome-binding protein aMBF1 (putative translation factor)
MFFSFRFRNKTIKELRKNRGYTADELAQKVKVKPSIIHRVDDTPLKKVPEPLYSKLLPVLRGNDVHKAPWL